VQGELSDYMLHVNNAIETKTDDCRTDESQNLPVKVPEWKEITIKKKDGGFDLKVNECLEPFNDRELLFCQRRYRSCSLLHRTSCSKVVASHPVVGIHVKAFVTAAV